jgi:hypothetical protein
MYVSFEVRTALSHCGFARNARLRLRCAGALVADCSVAAEQARVKHFIFIGLHWFTFSLVYNTSIDYESPTSFGTL